MAEKYEVDYEALLKESMQKMFDIQREYFALMAYINDHAENAGLISNNLLKIDLADQVLYLRAVKNNLQIAEKLIQKYGIEKEKE